MNYMSNHIIFSSQPYQPGTALGIIRIIVGLLLIYHGWELWYPLKMNEYLQWDQFKSGMASKFLVYAGKAAELISGFLLLLGFLTRLASLILAGTMIYIAFFIGHGKVWYEDQHPFLFILLAAIFFFLGPGKYSFDQWRDRKKAYHV